MLWASYEVRICLCRVLYDASCAFILPFKVEGLLVFVLHFSDLTGPGALKH